VARGTFRQPPQPQQARLGTPASQAVGSQTATPGVASLTLTAFAPVVRTPVLVTIGKASLTTATFAPKANLGIIPGKATLTITRLAPVTGGGVVPGKRSLVTTAYAPQANLGIVVPKASLTLTSFAPAVSATANVRVVPGTASLVTAAFAPTVTAGANQTAIPDTASLALTAYAPAVSTTGLGVGGTRGRHPGFRVVARPERRLEPVLVRPAARHLHLVPFEPDVAIDDEELAVLAAFAVVLEAA
jgi:hypothetical protein